MLVFVWVFLALISLENLRILSFWMTVFQGIDLLIYEFFLLKNFSNFFNSILPALNWGRNIFISTRRFFQLQLTVKIVTFVMVFMGVVVLHESPLNSFQIIWIIVIIDLLLSISIAADRPYGRLSGPLVNRNQIITN